MINGIKTIVDCIKTFIEFVLNAISGLIDLFSHIPQYLKYLFDLVSYLPSYVVPFVTTFVLICVLLFVINKGSD